MGGSQAVARILITDDDQLVRGTIQIILESDGHEAVLARDGNEGVQQLQTGKFDLVICDIFMPNKEGLETIRELRELSVALPIIAITGGLALGSDAQAGTDFLQIARIFGATQTLSKPFGRQELLALVQRCLDHGLTRM
jgi:CheY-like chemotaxis protein